ncbi:MAG: response regulator transcription factor [Peptococcaceae bacterium]|jgi:two-component system alkaline phosphatase synthesis response regulator PhoP|nr:response regulator transcription factor [Peptococcaceae bacterium]
MIYCVEDDNYIRELIVYALISSGFSAQGFGEGDSFFSVLYQSLPELVILDVMLPGEDGIRILKRLKNDRRTKVLPVILLTAKSTEFDKVLGLDSGADDYIAKPFGVMEMIARVKALLRRTNSDHYDAETGDEILKMGDLALYPQQHQVLVNGAGVQLTFKEFALLQYMMVNTGIALSREQILAAVWGYDYEGETRTVDMHIKTLRQKIGGAGGMIETVRGIGYKIGGAVQ